MGQSVLQLRRLQAGGFVELGEDADNVRFDAHTGRVVVGYGSGVLCHLSGRMVIEVDVALWHFSDVPGRPDDVRSRGKTGSGVSTTNSACAEFVHRHCCCRWRADGGKPLKARRPIASAFGSVCGIVATLIVAILRWISSGMATKGRGVQLNQRPIIAWSCGG